jgi:FkbM family methyltransferase
MYSPALDDFTGRIMEIFIQDAYVLKETKEPIQVLDCGANIGMALLYIKLRAPNAVVKCFEPNPEAQAVLKKNIGANSWGESVQVVPYALGLEEGTVDFFVHAGRPTSSSGSILPEFVGTKGREANTFKVEIKKLSNYIEGTIDFLKIDIEGGEFAVIEDLLQSGKMALVKATQIEFHYHIPLLRPLGDMLHPLEEAGFKTFVQPSAPLTDIVGTSAPYTAQVYAWR